ncbi:MAG: hypothetical protein A2744_03615 [Candidatus Buchananbacteria bacterium RIFCSPHIGHO2_01_FULL_44_11]|uniref:Non-canonical purine NTP pyrophosphatase n=1 Tax=Candidatus Buchananbacteria bacterium RIFCSPHIGHO2_01_FULL_44_11 TaxID=1797535 RepID=A0A1G1Y4J7_9BACT|nr:MAG: hypothetical protein A2744_03615 [Candidatus Buchananbacteria bacterium RIFCSPHIGHO2_01_FULL_44_11]
MQKLLIASANPAKVAEYKKYLADLPLELVSLTDLGISQVVVEDGKTFAQNAAKKVREYGQLANLPAINDDAGLEVDALNGEPGVKSRRWLGYRMTDQALIDEVLKRLSGVPVNRRGCQLVAVVALFIPGQDVYLETASVSGQVALKPTDKIIAGYPFRSFFWLPNLKKFYADLTEAEHEQFNHRRQALEKLKVIIKKELL